MRHPRFVVFANPPTLQTLVDALNNPRNPEEGDPGLGPSTCRSDASTYPGVDEKPEGPPPHRYFTLSVKPQDVDRFESICKDVGAEFDTWHPTGADGSKYERPIEFPQDNGLERLPDQAGGPK